MSDGKKVQQIDTRQLQDILSNEIDSLSKLRDRLSPNGEELSAEEKSTLRSVLSRGWFGEIAEEASHFFNKGSIKDLEMNQKYVMEVLWYLS